jgi:hypothetical protein
MAKTRGKTKGKTDKRPIRNGKPNAKDTKAVMKGPPETPIQRRKRLEAEAKEEKKMRK